MIEILLNAIKAKKCNHWLNIQRIIIIRDMNKYISFWKKENENKLITKDIISQKQINIEFNKDIKNVKYFFNKSYYKWWKLNLESKVEATKI